MRHYTRAILVAGLILVIVAEANAAESCAALTKFTMPGHGLVVRQAREVAASAPDAKPAVPAHCRVDGVIDARVGRDGKSYGIGFAVALPVNWNGQFLFQGGGGLNGTVSPPLGAQYAGDRSALRPFIPVIIGAEWADSRARAALT